MNYKFIALIFHFFFLVVVMFCASDCGSLDDAEILISPAVFWEFFVDRIFFFVPKVFVKFFELSWLEGVLSSCDVFPDVLGVAGLEPVSEKFL